MPQGAKRALLLGLAAAATLLFAALCVWQVERRAWKLALIEAVEERVHAPAVPAPPPSQWRLLTAPRDEYRHVVIEGRLLHDRETLVEALTAVGPGFWVMTPLQTAGGYTILINRGYVPADRRDRASRSAALPSGVIRITGLLRMSEPHGRFLRANRPDQDHWYSRDTGAIGHRRGLSPTAPYFIDADATPNPGGWPLGGLTVIAFPNNHLIYAITWLALALLSAAAFRLLWKGPARP